MTGERLGPWIIDAEIGRGAMGAVWKAHRDNGEVAAVKVLGPEMAREPMFVERFQREIEALSHLHHPNIVRFFEAGEQDGVLYYAMEFVDGPDCEKSLAERGRIPWSEVLTIAEQSVAGLKHAHDSGVIHRDLKPANILTVGMDALSMSDDGTVKLTDFGVAKMFSRPGLTAAGSFVGTAAYLSPEQAVGKPATKRSDFYSLGCVLYCLISGRPPFSGLNAVDLLQKHCHAQPEQLLRLVPGLPHDIDSFVMRLLEKDPAKRPADGFVILRTLERIRGKLERKAQTAMMAAEASTVEQPALTRGGGEPAPKRGSATLVAGLVRRELGEQNRGGTTTRFFNHPFTLLLMLAACVGLIVYGFTRKRMSADELVQAALPLMASDRPSDWEKAWADYLEPATRQNPNNDLRRHFIAEFREKMLDWKEQERVLRSDQSASEAERFYRLGLSHAQAGDPAGARQVWRDLTLVFRDSQTDRRWVELAERGLTRLAEPAFSPTVTIDAALASARQLAEAGKRDEAEAIWTALADLYRDAPAAIRDRIDAERKRGR